MDYKYKEHNDVVCSRCGELNYGIRFEGEEYVKCTCCGQMLMNIDYNEEYEYELELLSEFDDIESLEGYLDILEDNEYVTNIKILGTPSKANDIYNNLKKGK